MSSLARNVLGHRVLAAIVAVTLAAIAAPAIASARGPMPTVIQDDAQLLHRPETLDHSLQQIRDLGIEWVRVTAGWSVLTRDAGSEQRPDFDATDPAAYEQDRWHNLDRLVRRANDFGLKVMIDVAFWAPHWATDDVPGPRARTNVNAGHFRDFAVATVKRYRGDFVVPAPGGNDGGGDGESESNPDDDFFKQLFGGLGFQGSSNGGQQSSDHDGPGGEPASPLPEVGVFTVWNEPNHQGFLMPQWEKRDGKYVASSPHAYRRMVHEAVPPMKQAHPGAKLLVGGLSSFGSHTGRGAGAVPPLQFIREMACVDEDLEPLNRPECAGFTQIPGDGFAHHPYSLKTNPGARNKSNQPDNAPIGELGKLTELLNRLVAKGRLAPALRDVYLTEYGYETGQGGSGKKWSVGNQARFLPWAEYLAWRNPQIKMHAQFLLRDLPPRANPEGGSPTRSFGDWQSGLFFHDGSAKLAAKTFESGLFVERVRGKRIKAKKSKRGKRRTKKGRSARKSRTRRKPDTLIIWGRIRPGSGKRAVRLEVRDRSGAWKAKSSARSARAARVRSHQIAFSTSSDGVFRRVTRYRKGLRYRLSQQVNGRWQTSVSVRPVLRPVEKVLRKVKCPAAISSKRKGKAAAAKRRARTSCLVRAAKKAGKKKSKKKTKKSSRKSKKNGTRS